MTSASANATTSEKERTSRSRKLRRTPLARIHRCQPASHLQRWPVNPGSALGEGVPGTPHRQDETRIRRVVFQLLAQVADVDVDRLLVLVERLVVADQLQQLTTREDASRPCREVAQDLELGGGEADALVA